MSHNIIYQLLTSINELEITVCATKRIIEQRFLADNFFLSAPDTDFRDFLQEAEELAQVESEASARSFLS